MNGRTYSGFYQGYYLKSSLEYIYARYLDYLKVEWIYEPRTFQLSSGGSYKPDFQLLSDSSFVEIKGGFNYKYDLPRIQLFEKDYSCTVLVLQEKDLRALVRPTPLVFEHIKQDWIKDGRVFGLDTSGSNNPRYGVKMSDRTKELISAKAKQRMGDPDYKRKWLKGITDSEKRIASQAKRIELQRENKIQPYSANCSFCEKSFTISESWQRAKKLTYCSYTCSNRACHSKSFGDTPSILIKLASEYAERNRDAILNAKLNGIKPVLQPFYDAVSTDLGITDIRTISKILVGESANRKQLLSYFRSLVENVLGANTNDEVLELENKESLG